jgi:hypothetical protein
MPLNDWTSRNAPLTSPSSIYGKIVSITDRKMEANEAEWLNRPPFQFEALEWGVLHRPTKGRP